MEDKLQKIKKINYGNEISVFDLMQERWGKDGHKGRERKKIKKGNLEASDTLKVTLCLIHPQKKEKFHTVYYLAVYVLLIVLHHFTLFFTNFSSLCIPLFTITATKENR